MNCSSLRTINIPSSVICIEDNAFKNIHDLTVITSIDSYASKYFDTEYYREKNIVIKIID